MKVAYSSPLPERLAQCFGVSFVPNTAAGQFRIHTGFPRFSPILKLTCEPQKTKGPPLGRATKTGRALVTRPTICNTLSRPSWGRASRGRQVPRP